MVKGKHAILSTPEKRVTESFSYTAPFFLSLNKNKMFYDFRVRKPISLSRVHTPLSSLSRLCPSARYLGYFLPRTHLH